MAVQSVIDVYAPEIWASASLPILRDNLVMARLVHRDFEAAVARQGDRVHTRKPRRLTAQTWNGAGEDSNGFTVNEVSVEQPKAEQVTVVLDTLRHVTFIAEDFERTTSLKELEEEFLIPALDPIAQAVDDDIMTEMISAASTDVHGNAVAAVATSNLASDAALDEQDLITANKTLHDQRCPRQGRVCVLSTDHEADLLARELFHSAEKADTDDALRNAELGRAFGFQLFQSQNVPTHDAGSVGDIPQSVCFARNALSLVTRPLRQSRANNVLQASNNLDGIGIRVSLQYDYQVKGDVMSFDILYGVQLLDANYAVILRP